MTKENLTNKCNGDIKNLEDCKKKCPASYNNCASYIFEKKYQYTTKFMQQKYE